MVYSEPNEFREKTFVEEEHVVDRIESEVLVESEEVLRISQEVLKDSEEIPRIEIQKENDEFRRETEEETIEDCDTYDCNKTPVNVRKKSSKNPISRLAEEEEGNVTPMPSYVSMDTPSLRDELKRFGVKALPKKQAVKKLVEIYEFTHRHKFKRSASCVNFSHVASLATRFPRTISDLPLNEIDLVAKQMNLEKIDKPKSKKQLKKTISDVGFQQRPAAESTARSFVKIGSKAKAISEKTIDEKMMELASEDSEAEENSSSQAKNSRQKKSMLEEELREFVYDLITKDKRIYMDVLNYVPVDFDCIHTTMQINDAPR